MTYDHFLADVVLKTTSISQSTANKDSASVQTSRFNAGSSLLNRTDNSAVNPACKDIVTDSCDRIIVAEDNLEASLLGDAGIATEIVQDIKDNHGNTEAYSVDSESEIFITERRIDVLEDDKKMAKRRTLRRTSETSESSLTTDNDSLGPDSDSEHYLDESIM